MDSSNFQDNFPKDCSNMYSMIWGHVYVSLGCTMYASVFTYSLRPKMIVAELALVTSMSCKKVQSTKRYREASINKGHLEQSKQKYTREEKSYTRTHNWRLLLWHYKRDKHQKVAILLSKGVEAISICPKTEVLSFTFMTKNKSKNNIFQMTSAP